jgi:PPOX class probable F420-dependent enzyme
MARAKLAKANYLSLATFRKTGAQVATPVWFAEEDNTFYVFSAGNAGKIKRLRNSPRSRIAACTVAGKVTGEWLDTEAEVIADRDGIAHALSALRRKYGWQMRATDFFSKLSGKMQQRAYIRIRAQQQP